MTSKTVTVRIPVAVYPDGEWGADANSHRDDESNLKYLHNNWCEEHMSVVWITAEVPIPEPVEVEGRVESSRNT